MRPSSKARLHNSIVVGEVCSIERITRYIVDKILPTHGKAKDIEAVVVDKVLHLPRPFTRRAVGAAAISLQIARLERGVEHLEIGLPEH